MNNQPITSTPDLRDYISIVIRRRIRMGVAFFIVFAIGITAAIVWPPTYLSSATILIEDQEIPTDIVRSTITSFATQRIQAITHRVMNRKHLMEIIKKYNLYENELKHYPLEKILADMRKAISINMEAADIKDPLTGTASAVTIAFSIKFLAKTPKAAQQVASELTTLYLNENIKARTEITAETYNFITAEVDRLYDNIVQREAELATFKEENIGALPESRQFMTSALAQIERDLDTLESNIFTIKERRNYLESRIESEDPYLSSTGDGPGASLGDLKAAYSGLLSQYSERHPDVVSLKKRIAASETTLGINPADDARLAEISELNNQLIQLKQIYSDQHPDVISLEKTISALEDSLGDEPEASSQSAIDGNPTNPAYNDLRNRLDAVDIEIRLSLGQKRRLEDKHDKYTANLMQLPKLESRYNTMVHELAGIKELLQSTTKDQRTAGIALSMEKERKGERFTLIEPAIAPQEPITPNRPAIIFVSLILALGGSLGIAAISESLDKSIRGARGVISTLATAPLAVIPYLQDKSEVATDKKHKKVVLFTLIGAAIVVVLIFLYFSGPLDVLWFRGVRKVDAIISS